MQDFIPYGRQWIDDKDIKEVVNVLRSDWITQGPKIKEFEQKLARYCGAKYAAAVSNGTAALHLACLAAGFKKGDEVITSPNTFLASANSVLYCGGKVVFADIDEKTYNIDPNEIKKHITPFTKGITPVHFAGQPCDMEAIHKTAKEHDLIIIEDGAHAIGAEYKTKNGSWAKAGSCVHSDMTTFSFHPVKHITTGEGGVVLTNDPELYERLLLLRNHGMTKDPALLSRTGEPWYYEMQALGYNYRITDLQCALGISQLEKLDKFVERRREIAEIYNEALKDIKGVTVPFEKEGKRSSYHLYPVLIDFKGLKKTRTQVMTELRDKGVGTQVHYIPVHLQPYYRENLGYKEGDLPVAEGYYEKTLSLPMYPKMSREDIDFVIGALGSVLEK
jgi:UDP-4-amino-4,6-dideoxy-N-acetyl-beta-L-altrosamine transaminase